MYIYIKFTDGINENWLDLLKSLQNGWNRFLIVICKSILAFSFKSCDANTNLF